MPYLLQAPIEMRGRQWENVCAAYARGPAARLYCVGRIDTTLPLC